MQTQTDNFPSSADRISQLLTVVARAHGDLAIIHRGGQNPETLPASSAPIELANHVVDDLLKGLCEFALGREELLELIRQVLD